MKNFAQSKDILIAISSSGKSPNIIKAVETAKKLNLIIIGFMGFDDGQLFSLADAKIYIPSFKYTIVESGHSAICHLITNYFKQYINNKKRQNV